MWVIKLGGSLADYPDDLNRWLEMLAEAGRGEGVIVPGGGFFADWVREAQMRWAFDDAVAHAMALRAMEQYGLMLCGLQKRLVPACTDAEIQKALRENKVPVWLPVQMLAATEIEPSWDVTSDSLAAWMTRHLAAEHLVLVKSCPLPEGKLDMQELSRKGIVDAAFPNFVAAAHFKVWLVGRDDYTRVFSLLATTQRKSSRLS
ncbi:MAG TPA: aspartate kinase [Burkholderiales bacterium]|nr:aspartate kinase [Burkholderiales bacterium]